MTIRLLATDLDGTFLGHRGAVLPENVAAMRKAHDHGISVMFVTGRPPRWLPMVVDETGFTGFIVSANGGIVIDAAAREIVRTYPMSTESAREGARRIREAVPGMEFGVERADVGMKLVAAVENPSSNAETSPQSEFAMTPGYHPHGTNPANVPIGDINDLVAGDRAVKIIARPPHNDPRNVDEMLAIVQEALGGVLDATHSSEGDVLIEISAPGVSKGSTLAYVAEALGYAAHEVAACGDMPNDVPMLQWAGEPYIMANAHTSLHGMFENVLPPHHEQGVAQLLHALIERQA